MQLKIIDKNSQIEVSEKIFCCNYNKGLVHQAVVTFMNNARSGNSAQKTRSEVRGGGKKPLRQKGTGSARAGTIRSPLWRSGGIVFASKKRDYTKKLNKKMYKRALCSIISELYRLGNLIIVSHFECSSFKTKDFIRKMNKLMLKNALIVLVKIGKFEYLASSNLIQYHVCDVTKIDPVNLIRFEKVLITENAVKQLEDQLQ